MWLGCSLTRSFSRRPARSWSIYGKTMYTERGSFALPTQSQENTVSWVSRGNGPTSDNKHIQDFHNTRVFQGFEDLDLTQRSHRHPFLLVVHQNAFESDGVPCGFVNSLVDLPATASGIQNWQYKHNEPESSLPQFGRDLIISLVRTPCKRAPIRLLLVFSRPTYRLPSSTLIQNNFFPERLLRPPLLILSTDFPGKRQRH